MTRDTPPSLGPPPVQSPGHSLADQLAAAQAWWREAGVDLAFGDEPVTWLTQETEEPAKPHAQAPIRAAAPETQAPPPLTANREGWPGRLEDFGAWWLSAPDLLEGDTTRRVPPRGPASAELMILVAEPEIDDTDVLLGGPQGSFVSNMVAAMGISTDQTYFASVLPRPTPLADWEGLARAGLGEVARHHISLAAPKRLLIFGRTISSLLGHDPAQSSAFLLDINHPDRTIPTLACWDLAAMLVRAKARAGFWQRWLDWTVSDA